MVTTLRAYSWPPWPHEYPPLLSRPRLSEHHRETSLPSLHAWIPHTYLTCQTAPVATVTADAASASLPAACEPPPFEDVDDDAVSEIHSDVSMDSEEVDDNGIF